MAAALFIGRFQPLHKGHVFAAERLLQRYDSIIIAVGSINKHDEKNPFSFRERAAMLRAALPSPCRIIGVPDMPSDAAWAALIQKKSRFDVIVTGNRQVQRCFTGYKTVRPNALKPKTYSATRIRALIKQGKRWEHLVPKGAVPIIRKHYAHDL
ncbi:MAG: adenylyltransferase/cytidyltransferase family protein [Candidatus Aenigmarchaeota archaeon]|nr:adenylyltransferase/cytidyltransferase family protein [Candidatus Aenigmarchaeota archaeon]